MINRAGLFILSFFPVLSSCAFAASLPEHPLLSQAGRESYQRLNYAIENRARVELTADGKSFYVFWLPEGINPSEPPAVIVTIHGHSSWAFDEFFLWHKEAQKRGYGILAIQWWLGQGEGFRDYLIPQEIYRVIDQVLTREHIRPGSVLFHGFSRGAANSYAVAALDNTAGKRYFALIVANAGKAGSDYPPNRQIEEGRFGQSPFQGTRWVTFAGGRDPNPDRDGINGMRETGQWIKKYGGIVDLAIEDDDADHGGFHRNLSNMNSALEAFEKRLKSGK